MALSPGRFLRRAGGWLPLVLLPLSMPAQEITLHMDVKLVNVFVNVTDRNGAIVGGLTREDFALAEDGRPQQIAVFERQSELPLNLVLAIDTSGSVQKDMAQEADAARRFAHALLRPQDQMSVLQFATFVRELTPFTNKLGQIDRALGELRSDWATSLYDATCLGSERLGGKEGRKVLILVTDGDDTASKATYANALEEALRNEVMIYSIIDVPIEASAGRDLGGEHALITLAEADRRQELLRQRRGPRQSLRASERRSAHAVSAGLLSPQSGQGTELPPHPGDRPQGRQPGLQYPQSHRVFHRPAGKRKVIGADFESIFERKGDLQ